MRKSVYKWAVEYCGDPGSHEKRGKVILRYLKQEGMNPTHKVLDVGCGALSQGKPLIEYLNEGNYMGLDPNGWLIEAALGEFPYLLDKKPKFSYSTDFLPSDDQFDFVVAHSVLSHVADWQMDMALINIRTKVKLGARWLASLRLAGDDAAARNWVYPGVSHFRYETVINKATHAGWAVEKRERLKEALTETCPNDFHDWIVLQAVRTPQELNEIRLREDEKQKQDQEIWDIAMEEYRRRLEEGEEDAETE